MRGKRDVMTEPDSISGVSYPDDAIILTGLRVRAHHGVFEHERENGQDFVVDLTVWLDTAGSAATDNLAHTLDYGELALRVTDAVRRDPVDLIETVAERIASVVMEFPQAHRVQVTLHKPNAPISVPFIDVAVRIVRSRS